MESKLPPLIVPIYHHGCHEVLPCKSPYIPQFGKTVFIRFGEPLDTGSLLEQTAHISSPEEKRIYITRSIQQSVEDVKRKLMST
jgi:monolysocardiolipin acyltransferase